MFQKIILIKEINSKIINEKCHDLLNIHFPKISTIVEINDKNLITFFKNIEPNSIVIYYFQEYSFLFDKIINEINNLENVNFTFYFFTFDFWLFPSGPTMTYSSEKRNEFIKKVFKAEKYKVICFANNINDLNYFLKDDFSAYSENLIFNNIWSCYETSFCEYNNNPINKLLISGAIYRDYYQERVNLYYSRSKYIERYPSNKNDSLTVNNNYNLTLNKYFCCFASSVNVQAKDETKFTNTHVILLKTFEILAAGSLLVLPLSEEKYIEKIGLKHNINCYLINLEHDIIKQIDYIFDNQEFYEKVRFNGFNFAKNNLTSLHKFNELKQIFSILI
jgi:hypothetical protein